MAEGSESYPLGDYTAADVSTGDPPELYSYYIKYGSNINISSDSFRKQYKEYNSANSEVSGVNAIFENYRLKATGVVRSSGSVYLSLIVEDYDGFNLDVTIGFHIYCVKNYKVNYDANGGQGAPSPFTSSNKASDSYSYTISSRTPTRSGYKFKGWSKYSTGSASYQPGEKVTLYDINTTFYAVWESLANPVTLKYDANGGQGAPGPETVMITTPSHLFKISDTRPTLNVHIFLGWGDYPQGPAVYQPGETVTVNVNQTKILYAIWDAQIRTKVSGQVKEVEQAWCKVNGGWKEIQRVYEKINNEWK